MRFLSGTLILIALTGPVLAQDGLSAFSEPQLVNCKDKESIIPTCLFSRPRATTSVELITNDVKVCQCLSTNNDLFEKQDKVSTIKEESEKEKKRRLEQAAAKAGNSNVLQASGFTSNKREQEIALLGYGAGETRQKLKPKKSQTEVPTPLINEKIASINSIEESNKSWQCVTYQEYGLQRSLPSDNDFFQLLKTSEFKADDWNVNKLTEKFEAASEADKKVIRLKLTFLTKNPIFQSIMKAQPNEKFTAAKILEKQTQLFSILKTLSPSEASTCLQAPNGCFQEVLSNGKYQEYSRQVGQYLMDNDVIDISSAQAAMDYQSELEKITAEGEVLVNSVPTDPEGYFSYLQSANSEIFNECSGATVKPECYTKFSDHCKHINAIDQRVRKGIKLNIKDISAILREEESLFVSMNPTQNADFRSFNDKICLDPYANASGERLNFFQYQEKYCAGTALPECSDRKKLLERFLKDYNSGEVVADRNLRSGFLGMIADTTFQEVSEAQVLAANNINESPAELRARFGGEFPSISPTGSLVPFVPPASLANNSSASSVSNDPVDYSSDSTDSTSSGNSEPSRASVGDSVSSVSKAASTTSYSPLPQSAPIKAPALAGTNTPLPNVRKPASVPDTTDETFLDTNDETPRTTQNEIREVEADDTQTLTSGRGSGTGGGYTVSTGASNGASAFGGDVGAGSSGAAVTTKSGRSTKKKVAGSGLLFKYGLGDDNQPEVALVSATSGSEVKVSVDKNLMDRIKSNPNSLEIGQEDMDKIMATPDEEVTLVIQPKGGAEALVVYARKDSTGGVSFSLNKSNKPKTPKDVVRISTLPDVYDNIVSDPDVYLNQNTTLIQEVMGKEGKDKKLFLQVVSPGKRALTYEVIKKDEYIYRFKRVGP